MRRAPRLAQGGKPQATRSGWCTRRVLTQGTNAGEEPCGVAVWAEWKFHSKNPGTKAYQETSKAHSVKRDAGKKRYASVQSMKINMYGQINKYI